MFFILCVCVCVRLRLRVCVYGESVWTSHILAAQGPSNLNSRHVFPHLDVCLISIMYQRPADKHISYCRVENVRSKLRKLKSGNGESFSCRGLNVVCSEPQEVNILCTVEWILCSLLVYIVACGTVAYFLDGVQGCMTQSAIYGYRNGSERCEFSYGRLRMSSGVKMRVLRTPYTLS
jgi:hypothetical protein